MLVPMCDVELSVQNFIESGIFDLNKINRIDTRQMKIWTDVFSRRAYLNVTRRRIMGKPRVTNKRMKEILDEVKKDKK
ncbi:hypothetical protein [Photobacterium nomapromontoriensis]|uniref:hypothetical protein n=1 Tax=Photobacterium nomapromontoriensis TaxID=2910237 RepID=UPI003D0C5D65